MTHVSCKSLSIYEGWMENSSTIGEVQTEGENSQMKKPTDVTRGEKKNASKRHFKLRGAAACNFILR